MSDAVENFESAATEEQKSLLDMQTLHKKFQSLEATVARLATLVLLHENEIRALRATYKELRQALGQSPPTV